MTSYDPEKITFFAKTDARGKNVPFGIKAKDRQRHMYVVGKTGMGKSTLLENIAAQDIQNGEGVAFIDPHGSAVETLLEYVPEDRIGDVVYFAPFDLDNPVSFNVMEDVGPDKRHLVVSGLMSTFKKIWVDAWSARMEYILTNALLALIEYPDTTLLSVNRLFVDKAYRKKVVDYIKDPAVKSFWVDEFASYTDRFTAEALPAIQNKIGQFTGNPLIRNIIGQPNSSFDIRKLMDEKKILLMNLSKGLIGETNANLLGSMLTTRIYLAAMSRADLSVAKMKETPNFYFYVDEFQSFANSTFANILSEARKYHLNLIIAHQYIEQMEEDVRNAVFGNVGTTIAFRVGPFDAEVLETIFAPRFEAADLVNLGFAQIYLTLMIDGIGSQPFSASTLPPVEQPAVSHRNMVIESSRKLYASPRDIVEKLVDELHTPTKPEQQSKDKKNKNVNFQRKGEFREERSNNNQFGRRSYDKSDQNSFNKNRNERLKPETKTPEDLRKILSQIAGAEDGDKKEGTVTEDKTKKTFSKQKQTKSDTLNVVTGEFDKREKDTQKPVNQNQSQNREKKEDKSGDLKQALADVLKKANLTNKPDVQTDSKDKTGRGVSVVDKVEKREKREIKPEPEPEPDSGSGEVKNISTYKSNLLPKKTYEESSVRKVKVEYRKQHENEIALDNQKKESVILEERHAKNNLDAAEIKRMLRHSNNERSPFN